ncbi:hypothetical protein [Roseomonas sp. USHLN139]|uniref:hypothetical protein n=1 Tax=Roseomonas sp. USHLN139 TaxID=3081298 RepID=UPI003B01D5E9
MTSSTQIDALITAFAAIFPDMTAEDFISAVADAARAGRPEYLDLLKAAVAERKGGQ